MAALPTAWTNTCLLDIIGLQATDASQLRLQVSINGLIVTEVQLQCTYPVHLSFQLHGMTAEGAMTHEAAKTLVQAFISSRLDYCNSLLYGVSNSLNRKVQSIQNAAARLLTGTR